MVEAYSNMLNYQQGLNLLIVDLQPLNLWHKIPFPMCSDFYTIDVKNISYEGLNDQGLHQHMIDYWL